MSCNEQCPFQRLSSASGRLHQCVDHARKDDKNQHESLCTVSGTAGFALGLCSCELGQALHAECLAGKGIHVM